MRLRTYLGSVPKYPPWCTYLVGKPGADFLVQCGQPILEESLEHRCIEHRIMQEAIDHDEIRISVAKMFMKAGLWP